MVEKHEEIGLHKTEDKTNNRQIGIQRQSAHTHREANKSAEKVEHEYDVMFNEGNGTFERETRTYTTNWANLRDNARTYIHTSSKYLYI